MKKIFLNFFGKNAKNLLHFPKEYVIIIKLFLGVAQLVARYLGVVEAAGSSPVTQTKKVSNANVFEAFFVPVSTDSARFHKLTIYC